MATPIQSLVSAGTKVWLDSIDPDEVARWKAGEKGWSGGESYEEMAVRMVAAVLDLAALHPGEHVLVVSHGAAIRAVHAHAAGLSIHEYRLLHPTVANASLSAVASANGGLRELGPL